MKLLIANSIIALAMTVGAHAFEAFELETKAVADLISCPSPKLTQDAGLPDLWGCVLPGAEVVKVFINDDGLGGVENIKFMWNDWTIDSGFGKHTDKAVASAWLSAIATRFAPQSVDVVLAAYAGTSDVVIDGPDHRLAYTYWKGPALDERLFTITKR